MLWKHISSLLISPWFVIGDLDELPKPNEKFDAYKGNSTRFTMFNKFINASSPSYLGHLGFSFTWYNKGEASNAIFPRLDRALSTVTC